MNDKDYTFLLYFPTIPPFSRLLSMQFLLSQFVELFFLFFLVLLEILFKTGLPMKRRSDDPIGGAAPLPKEQLPTHVDMAREWRHTRLQMENANPGTVVANREVAKKVAFVNLFIC